MITTLTPLLIDNVAASYVPSAIGGIPTGGFVLGGTVTGGLFHYLTSRNVVRSFRKVLGAVLFGVAVTVMAAGIGAYLSTNPHGTGGSLSPFAHTSTEGI